MKEGDRVVINHLTEKKIQSSQLPFCEDYISTVGLEGTVVYKPYGRPTAIVLLDNGKELIYDIAEIKKI